MISRVDNPERFRHEYKLAINMSDYFVLRARLAAVMKRDINAGPDGKYRVRSIYFDNIYDKVLNEKIDGLDNRIKFRIRLYNNDASKIRLEMKSRIRGLVLKKSEAISESECDRILKGDIGFLKDRGDSLSGGLYAGMCSQMLKPVTVVDYLREAYVYEPGNVRVTFDSDIRSGLYSSDVMNWKLPLLNAGKAGSMILEVKYDSFIPEVISDIIELRGRQAGSFSKYAACRIFG